MATGSGFRARTGALTIMFIGGVLGREELLEILERALSGGMLGPAGDEPPREDVLDRDEPQEELGSGLDPPMRTSSKGNELLFVAHAMERWLRRCPDGPLALGPQAGDPLSALVCCWSAMVTHALAPEPLTLAELDRAVAILDSETVEEHLEAMLRCGLAEALPRAGEARYTLTDWGREGISPIVAAVLYECHYPEPDVLPPDVFDAEAAFAMALPLLRLPPDLRGSCRLGVRIPGEEALIAGAGVDVEHGMVIAASPLLDREPRTWATGSALEWCETVVDPAAARLEVGGDAELAGALVGALHETLFGTDQCDQRR